MTLLHQGQTRGLMLGNLVGSVGLFASLFFAAVSGRIEGVVGGLVIGDAVSLAMLLVLVRRDIAIRSVLFHLGVLSGVTSLGAAAFWLADPASLAHRAIILAVSCVALCIDMALVYRSVGRPLIERVRQRSKYTSLRSNRDMEIPVLTGVAANGDVAG